MRTDLAELTDVELAAFARVDRAAFAVLYDRYLVRIYQYCYRRLGNRPDAEDATSAVFIRCLERIDTFRGGSFVAWLFAIARSTLADRFRAGRTERLPDSYEAVDPGDPPEEFAMAAELRSSVTAMLAILPADQREVIELRLTGLRGAEIAEAMDRSVAAVKMLQLRAMKRLRSELNGSIDEEIL